MKTPEPSPEAARIETIRRSLMHESNDVRLGNDRNPEETARRLADMALELFQSQASDFEKVATLNQAHANLLGGGVSEEALHHIAGLSLRALNIAYPESTDAYTDKLNYEEMVVRLNAIELTSPDLPFAPAYEKAWEHMGQPIEPILVQSEQLVKAAIERNMRQQAAEPATGAFSPATDDVQIPRQATSSRRPSPLTRLRATLSLS